MPRAEVGSTKHLSNKMKAKGLGRLRWYCQVCERQMRDENGFKQHTQSESHVRQMLLIGQNANKHIQDYSQQFLHDFVQLLKTAHGTKSVHVNHFYQEYIANKQHVHMNATRWQSLTEFAKHLGREGICRVEDTDKGLHISWIDNSPEALRRQEAIRRKERQDKGDEEREQKMIQEQVERAHAKQHQQKLKQQDKEVEASPGHGGIMLKFGKLHSPSETQEPRATDGQIPEGGLKLNLGVKRPLPGDIAKVGEHQEEKGPKKPKNVFATAKKRVSTFPLTVLKEQSKKISEVERIMKEEMEAQKRRRL